MNRSELQQAIVAKINGDKETIDDFKNYTKANEHAKNMAIPTIVDDLTRLFGDKVIATEWPEPDSETGNNPDKIKIRPVGGGKPKTKVFYFDTADALGMTADNVTRINGLKLAKGEKDGAPDEYKRMERTEIDAALSLESQRLGSVRNGLKRAVRVIQQMYWINTTLGDKIGCIMLRNPTNVKLPRGVPKAYKVFSKVQPEDGSPPPQKVVTEGTLLGYDVQAALNKGGTIADLWETSKRGTKAGEATGTTVKVEKPETFFDVSSDLVHYLNTPSTMTALFKACTGAGGDANLATLGWLAKKVDVLMAMKHPAGGTFYSHWDDIVSGGGEHGDGSKKQAETDGNSEEIAA